MTSLCREQGRRGVTLQIPEALQWDVGSVQVAVIYGIGMGQDSSRSMQIGEKNGKEDFFFSLKSLPAKYIHKAFLRCFFRQPLN